MFYQTQLLRLLALVFLSVSGTTAWADGKTYPATICQYWTTDENAHRSRMIVSQFGRVGNDPASNRRLGVVCPLIRDSQRSGIDRVMVRATHRNCPGVAEGGECPGNTECTLRIMYTNGDHVRTQIGPTELIRLDESQHAAAFMFANWEGISVPDYTNAEDFGQGSTIVVFCRLAPGADLASFYVGERTD